MTRDDAARPVRDDTDRPGDHDGSEAVASAHAARLVADADRLAGSVDAAARGYARYLLGLGTVTAAWFVALGLVGASDRGVLITGVGFGLAVAALSVGILPRVPASRRGFARRWVASMAGWAVTLAVTLTVGLLVFRPDLAYWLVAAPLAAAPALIGALAERRSV